MELPSILWRYNVNIIRQKGCWLAQGRTPAAACLDSSHDKVDLRCLHQTTPCTCKLRSKLDGAWESTEAKILAQIQAGPVWKHTVQFSYSANFGLDKACPRDSQMPLLPSVHGSRHLCTRDILLFMKPLRARDPSIPNSHLDAYNPMKPVRTQELVQELRT